MSQAVAAKAIFTAEGSFVDPRGLSRAKKFNIIAGSMGALWFSLTMTDFLRLFAKELNATDTQIGLLTTVASVAGVFQILSAYAAERLGRRKALWAGAEMLRRIILGFVIFLPFVFVRRTGTAVTVLLAIVGISSVLANISATPWLSWIADLIPQKERGRFFGWRSVIVNTVIILFLPVFGRILDMFPPEKRFVGFAVVFGAGLAIGITDIIVHWSIPEPPMKKTEGGLNIYRMVTQPLRDRNFRRFFVGWGIFSFGIFITMPFYAVYFRETLNIKYTFFGILTSVNLTAAVAGSYFFGFVADKLGSKPVFNICIAASVPMPLVFFFATPANAQYVLLGQTIFSGLIWSGINIGFTNLQMGLSPREGRGMFIAVFSAATGLFASLAPILAGKITGLDTTSAVVRFLGDFNIFGELTRYHVLMLLQVSVCLMCIPFLLRIRETGSEPIGLVLANIMLTNPLRTFGQIGMLKAGKSARARTQAIRSLAAMKTRLATDELVARLDDPSVIVREETVNALADIGDPDAVPALLERLKAPVAHSSLSIIRALGMIGDERALEPLIDCLDDEDRHVRAAAARALGEMGNPKAIPALKELIRREKLPQVVANAVESLGEIGASGDLWEILAYLSEMRNPILKRQMALAVGNLLGRRDEFYRIMSSETRSRGREVHKLVRRLLLKLGKRIKPDVRALFARCEEIYGESDIKGCTDTLWNAGNLIARDIYGFAGPEGMLLEVAVLRDVRFAAGLWFIHMLRTGEIEATLDDVLLAVYFLASADYQDVPGKG